MSDLKQHKESDVRLLKKITEIHETEQCTQASLPPEL